MYYTMASQMRVIEAQLTSAQMNATMVDALQNVNKVMSSVNAQMNPQQFQQTMKQFSMEMEKMGLQQEMMQDQFDMLQEPGMEADADEVYNQILGEVGMSMNNEMKAGEGEIAVKSSSEVVSLPPNSLTHLIACTPRTWRTDSQL